jgi:ligand-binding SRPBCC domain-containing protein
MSQIVTDIVIRKTFVDGDDVLTWFDLHTARTDPLPTVNWRHVHNSRSPGSGSPLIPGH